MSSSENAQQTLQDSIGDDESTVWEPVIPNQGSDGKAAAERKAEEVESEIADTAADHGRGGADTAEDHGRGGVDTAEDHGRGGVDTAEDQKHGGAKKTAKVRWSDLDGEDEECEAELTMWCERNQTRGNAEPLATGGCCRHSVR